MCVCVCVYRDTNLLVWGVDLVEEHLMASAGIPVSVTHTHMYTCTHTHNEDIPVSVGH